MDVRRSFVRLVALTVVGAMPVMGMAGIASAKTTNGGCAAHPNKAKCKTNSGGNGSGGTGGATPTITVTASPNPLVETGQSEVYAVLQVETNPSFAGDMVSLSSSQLEASCGGTIWFETLQGSTVPLQPTSAPVVNKNSIEVVLDDDGNATVLVSGTNCAPGSSVIEADLAVAPYYTALTTLVANPPVVTPEGLTGYPNNEVETGDTSASGFSDVYAVFYVETAPVYAEQEVEISSAQLEGRCGEGWRWEPGNGGTAINGIGVNLTGPATTTLDDDGNAVFVFKGASCAAGDSQVIADVLAGTHTTYTFDYTIDPPQPTI